MKIIAVEEHVNHSAIGAASKDAMHEINPHFHRSINMGLPYSPSAADLEDLYEGRIADMDRNGIDVQVITSNATQILASKETAVALSREANDRVYQAVKKHPSRYAALATLPTPDPKAAAAELERCVKELGFKGATVFGKPTPETMLDEPAYEPILAMAARLDVPISLHPGLPFKSVREIYYQRGLEDILGSRFATFGWGWHMETGIQLIRLILTGVFDRYPNLQFITGHWGEFIPYYLERLDASLPKECTKLERTISEYFTQNMYVTPSGMFTLPQLLLCMQVVGADRIMYSVDYPYIGNEGARAFLENAPVAPADKEKIAHENAEKAFKL